MTRKLTQEEAEKRSLDVRIKMVGRYVNSQTKTNFKCSFCRKGNII